MRTLEWGEGGVSRFCRYTKRGLGNNYYSPVIPRTAKEPSKYLTTQLALRGLWGVPRRDIVENLSRTDVRVTFFLEEISPDLEGEGRG